MMRLLLFSNSTNAGEEYLGYTLPYIREFTKNKPYKAVFVPYAAVSISFDAYYEMVKSKLLTVGINLISLHKTDNKADAIKNAEMIIVGGGNSFSLLKKLQDEKLMELIQQRVKSGIPYIGWSAGSNLSCPTIKTTNDMPIVEPRSFNALGFIPFQINPHYTDVVDKNHAGETRDMRLEEFLIANQNIYVTGLREGTMFAVEGNNIALQGNKSCRIFKHGSATKELTKNDDFNFLMQ